MSKFKQVGFDLDEMFIKSLRKSADMLEVLKANYDNLELSKADFYKKYGYNVAELHERTVNVINSAVDMNPFERIHRNETVPNEYLEEPKNDEREEQRLLDHFAGLAMQSIVANSTNGGLHDEYHIKGIAIISYEIAKAMLKARKEALKDEQ